MHIYIYIYIYIYICVCVCVMSYGSSIIVRFNLVSVPGILQADNDRFLTLVI